MTSGGHSHQERWRSIREWIGIALSLLAAITAFVAFRDVERANDNTRKVEAERLLDEAWDLFGGKEGTTMFNTLPGEAGTLERAHRKIREALLKDPNNPRGYKCEATYYRAMGRMDLAVQAIQTAIGLAAGGDREELARDHISYGAILGESGKPDAAIREFVQAQAIDPGNPFVLYDLAIAYHAAGRDVESDRSYAEAIRLTAKARGLPVPASQTRPPSKDAGLKRYMTTMVVTDRVKHIS